MAKILHLTSLKMFSNFLAVPPLALPNSDSQSDALKRVNKCR